MSKGPKTDSIIFDIDGTLWDSRFLVARAWSAALTQKTGTLTKIEAKELTQLFGKPMPEIFAALFPRRSEAEYAQIASLCQNAEERALETEGGILYPGVAQTIPLLAERFPLYIVSNCQCGYIESFLKQSGLSAYFTDWLCYGDTKKSKGQTLLALMERAGLQAEGSASAKRFPAVYVGDILGDALACQEAGLPFIWASYGFGEVDASYYIEKISAFSELPGLLAV